MYLFYIEAGLKINNLSLAVQYPKFKPLKGFVSKIAERRYQATVLGDDIMQNTWKLVGNSSWGRLGMNKMKFKQRNVKHRNARIQKNAFFDYTEEIRGECSTNFVEVIKRKKWFEEDIPMHLGSSFSF